MKAENRLVWSSYGRTHVGGVRRINQDAFADLPDKSLWVVADGMGGHKDGAIASDMIVSAFKQFEPEKTIGATVKKIHQQLDKVNGALVEQAALTGENEIIGSTVVILYASQKRCAVVWSGDSRIYLFRRSQLRQLTRDHNNEPRLLAEGLTPEQVKTHPYAQVLTHAIGGEAEVYLDAQIQELRHGDIFLLCSDGLNKEVSDGEIENILSQMPYRQAVNSLMELSLQRGGRDNITIVLVQVLSE
jgi:serine/threonine protein phosphatase PrpC